LERVPDQLDPSGGTVRDHHLDNIEALLRDPDEVLPG
jgi:hypothetical protein